MLPKSDQKIEQKLQTINEADEEISPDKTIEMSAKTSNQEEKTTGSSKDGSPQADEDQPDNRL